MRILFAPMGYFLAHLTRCLAIAEALKQRGHEIGFLCVEKDQALLAQNGYEAFPVYSPAPDDFVAYSAPYDYQKKYLGAVFNKISEKSFKIKKMIEEEQLIYQRFKPDLVIFDNKLTVPFTASMNEILSVCISNLSMLVDNQPACNESSDDAGQMTIELQFRKELAPLLGHAVLQSDKCQLYLKLIAMIVPGLPIFENKAALPVVGCPALQFVGPLYWSGWDAMPKPDISKYRHKIVILVTLGSTFPFPALVDLVLAAFCGDNYRIIINMGGPFLYKVTRPVDNYEVLPAICLRAFLAISHVVIHHGGHGTTMEVLRAGLPSVMIPFNGDQIDIADRVEKFGCGISLRKYPADVSQDELKNAVEEVLRNPAYAQGAKRFKDELAHWPDSGMKAAHLIEAHYARAQQALLKHSHSSQSA